MRVRLKGLNTVHKRLADGSRQTYYYHRATGTRIEGAPGSAEFLAAFEAAGRSAVLARSAGTVEWLVRRYRDSDRFTNKLAASTREIALLNLKACEAKWGATPLAIVQNPRSRPGFLRWHEELARTYPRAADAKLSALARVFAWGVDQGHIAHNPIASFERAYRVDRSELIWLPEHVTAFDRAASPELRLALMLALHTGQRQGDLLALPWSAWDGEAISLRQGKSRRLVYVPATRALKTALDAAPRRATTVLVTPQGLAWARTARHSSTCSANRQAVACRERSRMT